MSPLKDTSSTLNNISTVSNEILAYSPSIDKNTGDNVCSLSYDRGKRSLRKTLANHIKAKFWDLITDQGYFFCPNQTCPVVYFNNMENKYFGLNEIHTTVMHKMEINSKNRPMCYCMNVLEKQILDELLVEQCCDSIKDIQEFTKANTGKDCAITNPSGRCCGKQIKELLEWAEDKRLEITPPLLEEAVSCCSEIEKNTIEVSEE